MGSPWSILWLAAILGHPCDSATIPVMVKDGHFTAILGKVTTQSKSTMAAPMGWPDPLSPLLTAD